ncbi:MAG: 1,4-dihydroxy-2-naphthoate octaprenyltransferase [Sediminibacterium sp.]|nr:1,4-dihydroxy-2-naphthoate octaprenyltransferase [Sediminibacterium sp.]
MLGIWGRVVEISYLITFRTESMILKKSTIQLLRFPFSFFLMPVFWFALSCVPLIDMPKAALIFFIIHILVYPSSNGYNSYMDRDTDSIGGLEHPMAPEKELFYVTIAMDATAIALSLLVSVFFTSLLVCYIICSRLYSYRGIRLKQFPVLGYMTVILNQGGLMFLMVYHGSSATPVLQWPWLGMAAACFLIGGFYPITQVYQHESDKKDGVRTISMLLGKRGTFIFCALMYLVAFACMFMYYEQQEELRSFGLLQVFFLPVLAYFFYWLSRVWQDDSFADFAHTMRMNWLASTCTNLGFITLLILQHIG